MKYFYYEILLFYRRLLKFSILRRAGWFKRLLTYSILRMFGWFKDRKLPEMTDAYRNIYGEFWIDQLSEFVEEFGGLSIVYEISIIPNSFWLYLRPLVVATIGFNCCPVADLYLYGEGTIGSVWIDEHRRFYFVDDEGMFFLGCDAETMFMTILLDFPFPSPPSDLREAMSNVEKWPKHLEALMLPIPADNEAQEELVDEWLEQRQPKPPPPPKQT